MRNLTICFSDFWPSFDEESNFITRALRQHFEVEVTSAAELCFYSVFGVRHELFRGPRVQVIGEPYSPDWTQADFAIGFDRLVDDRFLRLPLWAWHSGPDQLRQPLAHAQTSYRDRFCMFLVSNPNQPMRNAIFDALNERRPVTSPGVVFNNAPSIGGRHSEAWRQHKIDAGRDYRFIIAAENSQRLGYTTEKIVDAFLAGAIPIYWGDPLVDLDFDRRCFVNAASYSSVTELADAVIDLDDNSEAIAPMLEHPPLTRHGRENTARPERLENFLLQMVKEIRASPKPRTWRRRQQLGFARLAARRAGLPKLRRLL